MKYYVWTDFYPNGYVTLTENKTIVPFKQQLSHELEQGSMAIDAVTSGKTAQAGGKINNARNKNRYYLERNDNINISATASNPHQALEKIFNEVVRRNPQILNSQGVFATIRLGGRRHKYFLETGKKIFVKSINAKLR